MVRPIDIYPWFSGEMPRRYPLCFLPKAGYEIPAHLVQDVERADRQYVVYRDGGRSESIRHELVRFTVDFLNDHYPTINRGSLGFLESCAYSFPYNRKQVVLQILFEETGALLRSNPSPLPTDAMRTGSPNEAAAVLMGTAQPLGDSEAKHHVVG